MSETSMRTVKSVYKTARGIGAAFGIAMVASAYLNVLIAQAGMTPMPGMDKGTDSSQTTAMRSMKGAPLPFGIMIGQAATWMIGFQYMFEKSDGMLDGTGSVREADVLHQFQTTPTDMTMQTHMGMIMYAPTERFTLMAMLPYIKMSMGELHRDGTRSIERSTGIGDLEVRGLYSVYATKDLHHRMLVSFGTGIPTGSVNHRDAEGARLEYPMQLGSGTGSLLPGVIYLGRRLPWSWGADWTSTVPLGKNQYGYRQGDRHESQMWVARQLTQWVNVSMSARNELWGNTRGSDAQLDPTDEPTKDPSRQGGERLNAVLGATFSPPNRLFKGQQFLVQGDLPAIQSLDGPQLKRSYMVDVAWQWEF